MTGAQCALYARVSSENQARDNTIASQVTALRERIAADGFQLEPDHNYVDEGYSGAILLRPALERLRDAVAGGHVERIYVHAPDRLARRYAHQVLLIDEFHRAGAEIVFLNRPIGGTVEDDLLLQVQGVIAEYERAKILERGRRGRRHAAQSGSVSALTAASNPQAATTLKKLPALIEKITITVILEAYGLHYEIAIVSPNGMNWHAIVEAVWLPFRKSSRGNDQRAFFASTPAIDILVVVLSASPTPCPAIFLRDLGEDLPDRST